MEAKDNKEYQRLEKKANKITNKEAIEKMIIFNSVMMPRLKDGEDASEDEIEEMTEILNKKPPVSFTKYKPWRTLIYGQFTKEAKKHNLTLPRLFNIPYSVDKTFLNEKDENIILIEEGITEELLNPVTAFDLGSYSPKVVFDEMLDNLKLQIAIGIYNKDAEYNLNTKKKTGISKEARDIKKNLAKKNLAKKNLTKARVQLRKKVPEKKKNVTKEEFEKARKALKKISK